MTHVPVTEPLLTPAEVATLFRVDPKTVTRWAQAGKLTSIRTLGGHRRYREQRSPRPARRASPTAPRKLTPLGESFRKREPGSYAFACRRCHPTTPGGGAPPPVELPGR